MTTKTESDEAREIDRLDETLRHIASALEATNALRGRELASLARVYAALARKLLLERDEAVKMRFDRVERIASLERELKEAHVKNCSCCDSPTHVNHISVDPRCTTKRRK